MDSQSRSFVSHKCFWFLVGVVVASCLGATPFAAAAVSPDADRTFSHPSEDNQTKYLTLAPDTYTFRTDANPNGYHWVEWYDTYSGGSPVATAHLYYYDDTNFNLTTSGWVRAEIYKSDIWWNWLGWEAAYRWYVTVIQPKPDLIVQDISVSSPRVVGQSVTIMATIKNQGNADASSFKIRYYVDGSYIGEDTLSFGLNAGNSNNETISYIASSSGNHTVKVFADSSYQISESSESNNERQETYYWNPPPKPDLIIQDISISPSSPTEGQSATITATIKNQGNADASSFKIRYYVDGSYIGEDTLSFGLNAGNSNNETISYTASSSGNHTVKVFADSSYQISESSESNNERQETYYWNPPPEVISPPTSITGNSVTYVAKSNSYTAGGASSNLGHSLQYQFDWGDGNYSAWGSSTQSHSWGNSSTYNIKARARCASHPTKVSDWSGTLKSVSVIWVPLSVSVNPGGSGSVTKNPDRPVGYSYGEIVQLTANANSGYIFDYWSGDASGSSNPISITMNSSKTITANFRSTPDIRIEPLTINIDAELGGAVSSQLSMTPSSGIKALDISDPNSNLGEISLDEIVIRFRAEESAVLHTYRVVYNLSDTQLLSASDTLGTEALPGELLGLQPFVAGAKKIQQIVSNNQSITKIITSDNSLNTSEIDLVSESIKNNIEDHGPGGLFYAKIAQDTDIRDICIELMQRADVVYAHPSPICHIKAIPNDPLYNRMWNLDRIGMPTAWDISGNTLGGVRVCVVDTGVRITHTELAGRTADATDVYLGNGDAYADSDPDNDDPSGHGTSCAGIIAAIRDNGTLTVGIAPVTIIPVNGAIWNATTSRWDITNYTDGVFWGVDHGADVISLSFGSHRSSPYQVELEAATYAENHGVVVCAAAGNDDGNADDHYPSAIPYYICVAAVDDDDERVTEPKWWWGSNFGDTVDLCAPGQGDVGASNDSILTLDRDSDSDWTNSFNGTSSATPHVAGVCALLAHVNPSLTAQEIRNIIEVTAEDQIGDPGEDVLGWDQFHGHGLINAASAIAMATHSFTIFNDGSADLHVTNIAQRDGDDWLLSWNPSAPLTISPGESQIVTISIDPELADIGSNDERLLVYSDDNDKSPYPGGVYVNLNVTCILPTIEQQPQDITVCEGQDAVFEIVATGSEPLQYQWKKDGNDVGIDSSELTLYSLQLADDGSEIWCEVTNECGSLVVSTSAFLTVYPWPTVTINPNPDQLNAAWTLEGPNGYTYSSNGDETIADLEFGSYTITWSTIPRWNTPLPNPDPKNLSVGNSINFIGNYQLIGDLNNDYSVDYEDLARLANEWLWTGQPGGIPEDIMQDGIVNFADFALIAENWLQSSIVDE